MATASLPFSTAASSANWQMAFSQLNGMSMPAMLSSLDQLDAQVLDRLLSQRGRFSSGLNMPRIEYAIFVVKNSSLPVLAPGDLLATNQVQQARDFLAFRGDPQQAQYTGTELSVSLPDGAPVDPDSVFTVKPLHLRAHSKPMFDERTGAVIGYVYQSQGYFEFYDVDGKLVATDEIGLETPLFDPIDILFIVSDLVVVAGKGVLAVGAKAAAKMGTRVTLRALSAGVLDSMRAVLRKLITTRTLKFTETTAAHMASKNRYVPVQILQLAIKYGKRVPDPQGAAGAFRYAIKMMRGDAEYVLELVLREKDWTVLHFKYAKNIKL